MLRKLRGTHWKIAACAHQAASVVLILRGVSILLNPQISQRLPVLQLSAWWWHRCGPVHRGASTCPRTTHATLIETQWAQRPLRVAFRVANHAHQQSATGACLRVGHSATNSVIMLANERFLVIFIFEFMREFFQQRAASSLECGIRSPTGGACRVGDVCHVGWRKISRFNGLCNQGGGAACSRTFWLRFSFFLIAFLLFVKLQETLLQLRMHKVKLF